MVFIVLLIVGVLLLVLEAHFISDFWWLFLIIAAIILAIVISLQFKNSINKFKRFYKKNFKEKKIITIILTIIAAPILILLYALLVFISLFLGPLILPFWLVYKIGNSGDYNSFETSSVEREKKLSTKDMNKYADKWKKENDEYLNNIKKTASFYKELKYCCGYVYNDKSLEETIIQITGINGGRYYRVYDFDDKTRKIVFEPENEEILKEIKELEKEIEKHLNFKGEWKEKIKEQKPNNTSADTKTNKTDSDVEAIARENCKYLGLITSGTFDETPFMVDAIKSVHNSINNRRTTNRLVYDTFGARKYVFVPDKWNVSLTGGTFWDEKEKIFYYSGDTFFPLNEEECRKRIIATYNDVVYGKVIIFHKGKMIKYKDFK